MESMRALLTKVPVVPVLSITDEKYAVPLAQALVAGGLPVLEITLRTPVALACVEKIVRAVPEAIIGVGTCIQPAQVQAAADAGAQFIVTPGTTDRLIAAAQSAHMPLLPGVTTASEVIRATEAGFSLLKFFPAESAGGVAALKAFSGPFSDVLFCPTGGISRDNARDYLKQNNVICVGGSWFAPAELLKNADWQAVQQLAEVALAFQENL
ncbi:MAG: bifunctional 4-hydroxy-2-oxoglutarate aldolase/2-dehydro-3-deoxy-phosphogluconate aldolase [Gammaproteobacteria bacterium]|nr:bifunctional 4-hydroxy-2-oxoglutarate aldolase/2-dehydro-3-deoxy-phosphogluconate aldolase [Gammaproteobacteria bacterium]